MCVCVCVCASVCPRNLLQIVAQLSSTENSLRSTSPTCKYWHQSRSSGIAHNVVGIEHNTAQRVLHVRVGLGHLALVREMRHGVQTDHQDAHLAK